MSLPARLILVHKQSTSGRVRFLCLPDGVLVWQPLPAASVLQPENYSPTIQCHPAALVQAAENRLALPAGSIEPAAGFQAWVATPAGDVAVLLAVFAGIDPPFAAAREVGGAFIALTETRALSELERQLLRRVYEFILG